MQVRVSGSDCDDGTKFTFSWGKRNRKQFLLIDGKIIIAFAKKGEKFSACESFTEVTSKVSCKVTS